MERHTNFLKIILLLCLYIFMCGTTFSDGLEDLYNSVINNNIEAILKKAGVLE